MKKILLGFIIGIFVIVMLLVSYCKDARSQEEYESDSILPIDLYGIVTDQRGRPIEHAEVCTEIGWCDYTDDEGFYSILLFDFLGCFPLTATHPDHSGVAHTVCKDQMDPVNRYIWTDFRLPCWDSDGDGLCNYEDDCPLDPDNTDSDGDGLCNGADECPNNPNTPAKGTCVWGDRKGRTCYDQLGCGCNGYMGCDMGHLKNDKGESLACDWCMLPSMGKFACRDWY